MKKLVVITSLVALLVGVGLAVGVETMRARSRFDSFEVTFLAPQQAVIFWKTKTPSIGYIRYGTTASSRETIAHQTSSEPAEVHAVVLEQIPPGGLYVSLHEVGESRFIFPQVHFVQYDGSLDGMLDQGAANPAESQTGGVVDPYSVEAHTEENDAN